MSTVADVIINDIRSLPAPKLVELLRYLNKIDPEGAARRRSERNRILEQTAGSLAGPEGGANKEFMLETSQPFRHSP